MSVALIELDLFIRNGAFTFEISDNALELWEELKENYKTGASK